MLLPLADQPFTPPVDRDMLPSERREFVRTHRTCVFGYGRRNDGPAMSIVYYIPTDAGELLVSTMDGRGKARIIGRDNKISLCILDERWPFRGRVTQRFHLDPDGLELTLALEADEPMPATIGWHPWFRRVLVDGDEPCGRKLDFLLQEMNREINTIGSKADGLGVSELIINAKAELERMREQVQNVE